MAEGGSSMVPKLKYFNLKPFGGFAGRGGTVRFYMLSNGMKFEEEIVDWDEWGAKLKEEAVQSGEILTGHLPVLLLDGQRLIESFAIMRRLAKRLKQCGDDEDRDYLVDMVTDASAEFRLAFLKSTFGGPEDKEAYLTSPQQRRFYYHLNNKFIEQCRGSGPHIVGDKPSFADAAVFCLLWDDSAVHKEDAGLWEECPKLSAFYKAYMQQEAVMAWCKGMRPDLC